MMTCSPIEVARAAALAAGELIRNAGDVRQSVEHKSSVDLVTQIDRAAERLIVERLSDAFPTHAVVAEESSPRAEDPDRPCWYVDPLDGTTNFVHGLQHSAVSIALMLPPGNVASAVVYDPFKDDMFEAVRGEGATVNGRTMRVSTAHTLDEALFVTGFPYDRREQAAFYLRYFEAFMVKCRDIRRFGSAALDLCYVACGRFDGFWEWRLKPWDTAAGWLIAEESGGCVTDFDGSAYDPWVPRILATNGHVHREAMALLAGIAP
jgi:myo-inositol-1(or 4)-monophosphatase